VLLRHGHRSLAPSPSLSGRVRATPATSSCLLFASLSPSPPHAVLGRRALCAARRDLGRRFRRAGPCDSSCVNLASLIRAVTWQHAAGVSKSTAPELGRGPPVRERRVDGSVEPGVAPLLHAVTPPMSCVGPAGVEIARATRRRDDAWRARTFAGIRAQRRGRGVGQEEGKSNRTQKILGVGFLACSCGPSPILVSFCSQANGLFWPLFLIIKGNFWCLLG